MPSIAFLFILRLTLIGGGWSLLLVLIRSTMSDRTRRMNIYLLCLSLPSKTVIRSTNFFKTHESKKKIGKITTNKKGGLSVLLVKIESCEMLVFVHRKLLSDGNISTSG